MKLLLLSNEFPPGPGGIGTHAFQIAYHLSRLEWNVSVVARQDYASEFERDVFNKSQNFEVVTVKPMPSIVHELVYRIHLLSRSFRRTKPDMIIATGERMVWLCALFAPIHKCPWIAIGHGSEFTVSSTWEKILTRWSFTRASAVVCVSKYTENKMLELGVRPKRQTVIPNGADDSMYHKIAPRQVGDFRRVHNWADSKLLLTVGRVCERKGQDTVIRSLPLVLTKIPNVHYLIVGLPEEREDFSRLATELGVIDHVHFFGKVAGDQLPVIFNASDIFLLLSRKTVSGDIEGYGIVVVEAALCGVPAIVSQDSGLVEAIDPGVTGLAVSSVDVDEVAEAVVGLINDDKARKSMGQAAYERAIREQTWGNVSVRYNQFLLDVFTSMSI